MKKCPYCAEEIQDEAKLCRWCQKPCTGAFLLPGNLAQRAGFVLLLMAAFSFFMPFAKFYFPVLGTQSFSGAGLLSQALQSVPREEPKRPDNRLSVDLRSLQKMMNTTDGVRVFRSRPVYIMIPVGLICGVLAYGLLVFIGVALWVRRPGLAARLSAISAVLVLPFLTSLFLIDGLLRVTLARSLDQLRENPFANLAATFTQGMRVEPSTAIFVLALATILIAVINWRRT